MKKEFMLKNNYKEELIEDFKEKMIEFYTPKGEEKMIS